MDRAPDRNRADDRHIDRDQESNRKSRIKRKQTGDRKNAVSCLRWKETLFMKSKRSDSFYFLNIENNGIM